MDLRALRQKLNRDEAARDVAGEALTRAEMTAADASASLELALEAQRHAQAVAEAVQRHTHAGVAGVVSRCLSAVFDDPYEFDIVFERKRGRTEARLVLSRDGVAVEPESGAEGGVLDVCAFALRLACLMLSRPRPRLCVVLDEPFKWVHGTEQRRKVRDLLLALSEELGVQIIMVTGIDALKCGNVIEL